MDENIITGRKIPTVLEELRTVGISFYQRWKVQKIIKKSMDYDSFTINIESFKNACKMIFVKTIGYGKEEGYVVKNTKTSW